MNWQNVLIVYCLWMMAMSVISLMLNIRNTRKHFEQGEKVFSIKDPLQEKREQLLNEIEKEIRRCKHE